VLALVPGGPLHATPVLAAFGINAFFGVDGRECFARHCRPEALV